MDRRSFVRNCSALAAAAAMESPRWASAAPTPARKTPYIMGADISWIPEDEAQGAQYFDRGQRKDIFDILKAYKFNYVALRIFVNPSAPGGYSRQGFCDLENTKKMAKRIKAAGMGFLIGFHFSDTWTSPGHQAKPSAWRDLSFPDLTKALHDWVKATLVALKDNGTPPQIAKIGNEMTDGIMVPEGAVSNFDNFATLIKAGCAASREVDPKIQIALHHHLGRDNAKVRAWVDNFLSRKTDFDIITMSCYAEANKGQDWKSNFNDLAVRYPKLKTMAQEYSSNKRALNDVIFNAPNEQGLGSFIWEPCRWMEAIFDKNGLNAGDQENNKPHLAANPMPGAATQTAASQPATAPATQPGRGFGRSRGGRYDTNAYALTYLEMAKAYGLGTPA